MQEDIYVVVEEDSAGVIGVYLYPDKQMAVRHVDRSPWQTTWYRKQVQDDWPAYVRRAK